VFHIFNPVGIALTAFPLVSDTFVTDPARTSPSRYRDFLFSTYKKFRKLTDVTQRLLIISIECKYIFETIEHLTAQKAT
jgi:hypothetical protein